MSNDNYLTKFATAGLGGSAAWLVVHPFSTLSIQMNLALASGATNTPSFFPFVKDLIKQRGIMSLYDGLSAGIARQLVYATSRIGLFEVYRDNLAKYRKTDLWSRLAVGVASGGSAALISCPVEVALVRISNDKTLPEASRRNYKGVFNAFSRILKEEGFRAFFSGSGAFVNRAMVVGAIQVGTYDQFRDVYNNFGFEKRGTMNVFLSSMSAGLIYSLATMPFESAKNRMAFQKPDASGKKLYTGTFQAIKLMAKTNGILSLWNGFPPYYLRCGGHTVLHFLAMEGMRKYLC